MASQIKSPTRPTSASAQQAAKVKNYVNQQIEKTRQQVKTVDLMAGALMLFVYALAFLLVMSLIDAWVWPLSPAARWVCLGILIIGGLVYAARSILPLFLKQINPDYAAKMIEEVEPSFQNSLINYVSFRKQPTSIRPAVLDAISRQAATDLASVPGDATVDRSKLIRLGFVLIGLTVFAIGYKLLSPKDPLQTFGRILFPTAKIAEPARVSISNVEPGDADLFFGDKLVVTAEVRGAHRRDDVRLVYSTLDGQLVDQSIVMQPADDGGYRYQAQLSMLGGGVQSSLTYKVTALDGSSPDYEVNVRPNPSIAVESVQLAPPKYTGLDQRTIVGRGDIEAVEGTWVTVNAVANLPIEIAYIELLSEVSSNGQRAPNPAQSNQYRIATTPLEMKSEDRSASGRFQITLDSSREKAFASHYRIRFVSTENHRNAEPNIYPIRVIPDQAPEVRFRNPVQTEVEVPVNGALAIDVEASDIDFSISSIALSIDHLGNKIFDKSLPLTSDNQHRSVTAKHVLRPSELGLKPGDQAVFFARAADNRVSPYSQQLDPNISRTENYFLKVTAWDQGTERKKQQPSDPQPSDTPKQKPNQSDQKDQSSDPANQDNDGSDTGENKQPPSQSDDSDSKQEPPADDNQTDSGSKTDSSDGNQGNQEQPNGNDSGSTDSQPSDSQSGSDDSEQPESESQGGDNRGAGTDGSSAESAADQSDSGDRGTGASESPTQQPENSTSGARPGAGDQSGGSGDGSDTPNGGSATDTASRDGTGQNPSADSSDSSTSERRDDSLTDGEQEVLPENASDGQRFETIKKHLDENGQSNSQPNSDPNRQSQSSPEERQNDSSAGSPGEQPNTNTQPSPSGKSDQPATEPGSDPKNSQQPDGNNQPNSSPSQNSQNQPNSDGAEAGEPNQQPRQSASSENQSPKSESPSGQRGSNDGNDSSESSDSGTQQSGAPQPGSTDSKSQSSNQDQPRGSGDSAKQPSDSSNSSDQGSPSPNENGGNPSSSNNAQQNSANGQSQNPSSDGGQPGKGDPSQAQSSQSSSDSNSQNPSGGGTGNSSTKGSDIQKRDQTNLEYAKKVVELSLEKLRDQPSDPELLRKLNMTQQELDQFLDRYRKMKLAAETGDAKAKSIYEGSLPPLGLKDPTQRRTNAQRAATVESLKEDSAVNRPPPEFSREFNSFMRNLQRTGNQ